MKTFTTRQGIRSRNAIGDMIDALAKCETAALSEARAGGREFMLANQRIKADLAATLFAGAARRFIAH